MALDPFREKTGRIVIHMHAMVWHSHIGHVGLPQLVPAFTITYSYVFTHSCFFIVHTRSPFFCMICKTVKMTLQFENMQSILNNQ